MQSLNDLSNPKRIKENRERNRRIEEAKAAGKVRALIQELEHAARSRR